MHVQALIEEHPKWLEYLERELKIKASRALTGNLVSLKYDQIESPMDNPIVQECRGMVVNTATGKILAHPYNKFWNHGEALAVEIDWSSARVLEKLDGSLMILYWDDGAGQWTVASSGTPTASGSFGSGNQETFAQGFWRIWAALEMKQPYAADRDMCFMFELCSHENRIVVEHQQPRIVLHGARCMTDGGELSLPSLRSMGITYNWEVVKSYPIKALDEALLKVNELNPHDHEGFVVVDAKFNRVKIKSPSYVALHHMRGEGMNTRRAVELWVAGAMETEELLVHFPEYKDDIEPVHARLDECVHGAVDDVCKYATLPTRKEFALSVKDQPWSAVSFKLYAQYDPGLPTADMVTRAYVIARDLSGAALERMATPPEARDASL